MRALDIVVVIAIAGCNPYDRDLGPRPFLCGASEPRCPKDYTCMTDPATGRDVCFASGATMFSCADDSALEANDTIQTATAIILDAAKTSHVETLAICPAGDVDTYSITVADANANLEVIVTFEPDGATLTAAILGATGAPIVNATPAAEPETIRAFAPTLAAGVYYAQIAGPQSGLNNYALTVTVTGP